MFKKKNSFKSGRKPTPRRSASLSALNSLDETLYSQTDMPIDYDGEIKLALGTHELVFRGGQWVREREEDNTSSIGRAGSISSQAYSKLEQQNQKLQEENNLLRYKMEALLDMMAVYIAEHRQAEREAAEKAKKQKSSPSSPEYDVIN